MDRVLHTMDDGTEDIWYFPGNRVIHQGRVYRCKLAHNTTSGPTVPTAGGGVWDEEGAATEMFKSVPSAVLLDAWNNPILFVPASGLLVRQLGTKSSYDPADRSQTYVIVSPEGIAEAPQLGRAGRLVRPGKPFFVSAGPDGDYATADDNLYSFEE
jgi:hypothetical protein